MESIAYYNPQQPPQQFRYEIPWCRPIHNVAFIFVTNGVQIRFPCLILSQLKFPNFPNFASNLYTIVRIPHGDSLTRF